MTDYITDFENQAAASDETVKKLQDSMQSWLEVAVNTQVIAEIQETLSILC